jgi:2-oxoglutarate ferredoxin oxidoreductase subunit delta
MSASKKWVPQINRAWCKGCGICVTFCPKGVLILNDAGKAEAKFVEQCVGCRLCEMRCPDFALRVVEVG